MTGAERPEIIAILLAAGLSRRFGADKLGAMIDGRAVIERSASALAACGCSDKIAVVGPTSVHKPLLLSMGFKVIENAKADEGISSSIRTGVAHAQSKSADGVLIALADMPFVDGAHFDRLIDKAVRSDDGLSFSTAGTRRTPPAVFMARRLDDLLALTGDAGARMLLKQADLACGVEAPDAMLRDIDAPSDIET